MLFRESFFPTLISSAPAFHCNNWPSSPPVNRDWPIASHWKHLTVAEWPPLRDLMNLRPRPLQSRRWRSPWLLPPTKRIRSSSDSHVPPTKYSSEAPSGSWTSVRASAELRRVRVSSLSGRATSHRWSPSSWVRQSSWSRSLPVNRRNELTVLCSGDYKYGDV